MKKIKKKDAGKTTWLVNMQLVGTVNQKISK